MKNRHTKLALTVEEKKIEQERMAGLYVSMENFEVEKKRLMEAASLRERKTQTITLRIQKSVLQRVKEKAQIEGIPYQTLIGSILHKFVQVQ
jgi:predicted DNA binding CopG/RHH family protein